LLDGGTGNDKLDKDKKHKHHHDTHWASGDNWFVDTTSCEADTSAALMDALLVTGEHYVFSEPVMADREAEEAHGQTQSVRTDWEGETEWASAKTAASSPSWLQSFVNDLAQDDSDNPNANISIDVSSKKEKSSTKGKR